MKYIVPVVIALIILTYEIYKLHKRKVRKKIYKKGKIKWNNKYIEKLEKIIDRFEYLSKIKNEYAKKLTIINQKKQKENRAIVTIGMCFVFGISIIAGVLLLTIFTMWYVVLLLMFLVGYMVAYGINMYIDIRLKKIHKQFPIALQLFTDEYITTKSIKTSLSNTYEEMPKQIGYIFERLTRKLTSGYDYKEPLDEFAKSFGNYNWPYAFKELLIMSYEGAGDISEELLFLNELVNEDITAEEEDKTEQGSNKMMFLMINGATLVFFLANLFINPIAKELYFYTSTGNIIILIWIGVIVLGVTTSVLMEHI